MDSLKRVMLATTPLFVATGSLLAADATQPATQPATNPATQPGTAPAPQPATQPAPLPVITIDGIRP